MKPNGLLIAVGLLAVLGGVVWWSNKKQTADAGKSPTDTVKILSIPAEQFQEIRIKKVTGEVLDLRKENGKWRIAQPEALRADQDTAGSIVSNLSTLNADKVIDENPSDLKPYGLTDPTLDVVVTKTDGKTEEVLVGDDTPTGSGAYAKLPNDHRVFTIGSFVKTGIDKTPDDLRDKHLLSFDSDKLTRVALETKGAAVEFGKNSSNEWTILKPHTYRADSSQVDTLVGKLKDAKMDSATPDADAAKKFAAGAKVATATVVDSSGTQSLEVRKSKDDYYAKSSVADGVYKVAADLGTALDKTSDDFRNKKLFDFGFSDPSKLEVQGVTYTKSGDKWMSGAKAMDNISVQGLIDKLRDISALKFSDKTAVGGSQVFQATVTSNNGKRVEKVTIRKEGDQNFAQRDDEPNIYEMADDVMSGLMKSISEVKPETPAKK